MIVELVNTINSHFGLNLPATQLYDHPNINRLAQHIGQLPLSAPQPEIKTYVSGKNSALLITGPGKIEDLEFVQLEIPSPAKEEVQIAVKAASVMLPDLLCVKGLYPSMPPYPFTPGFEISGTVIDVGAEVTDFRKGDQVFGITGQKFGGHAEQVNAPEAFLVHKPHSITHIEACCLPVAFLTAYYALEKGELQKGEKILIQSAASSTGLMALQLAQLKGAEIFATVGSDEKIEYLKNSGLKHVINYQRQDFTAFIQEQTQNQGVDVVFNMLSGDAIQGGMNVLNAHGRYLELAVAGLKTSQPLDLSNMVNNQSFYSLDLRKQILSQPQIVKKYLQILLQMLAQGEIRAPLGKVFAFKAAKEGYTCIQQRESIGKVVLQIHPDEPRPSRPEPVLKNRTNPDNQVAVIGAAGKFPGADDLQSFWQSLQQGRDAVTEVPSQRWPLNLYYDPEPNAEGKTYSKWGGFLNNADHFDAAFFNISPAEAELMDPQQRLFLQECFHALEDAGYNPEGLPSRKCGVFVGVKEGDYARRLEAAGRPLDAHTLSGSSSSILAARIAYILDLNGPNIAIDTACSSSLVAVHQGCRSIINRECDMALAGGVCVLTTPQMHIMTSKAGMLSSEGRCKTFDQDADGFVPSEGVGVVLLKSMEQAMQDNDYIYGVIIGSTINQDGSTNGITAPSAESQRDLQLETYRKFSIDPSYISYVEAHGTGTRLGDPIEIKALTESFQNYSKKQQYCAIGSVKTNIGHALAAAGIAGLLKVLLCLQHRKIVAGLNFRHPNPHIDFTESPFYVATALQDWEAKTRPRTAAVNAFGFSGTNCHMVVSEAPTRDRRASTVAASSYLFTLSAKTEWALQKKVQDLLSWLQQAAPSKSLEAVSYTLNWGRTHYPTRMAWLAGSLAEFRQNLLQPLQLSSSVHQDPSVIIQKLKNPVGADSYLQDLETLGKLYLQGADIDWQALYGKSKQQTLPLPTYPFAHKSYWIDSHPITSSDVAIGQKLQSYPLPEKEAQERRQSFYREANLLGALALIQTWQNLGIELREGNSYTLDELETQLGLLPSYTRLYPILLKILQMEGWIEIHQGRVAVTSAGQQIKAELPHLESRKEKLNRQYPELSSHVELL